MPNEAVRAYIYRVLAALSAVAILYGLLSADEVNQWLFVAATVLNLGSSGMAALNTSTKS